MCLGIKSQGKRGKRLSFDERLHGKRRSGMEFFMRLGMKK